jgi:hypothetical protein
MGGILFIDEAYALTEGRHPQFGKKAVSTIIKQMEDKRGQFGVIVAGYPGPMENFLQSNPGVQSRFEQTYYFKDFSVEELNSIAHSMFASSGLTLDEKAAEHLLSYIEYLHRIRNKYFGNARSVRKIVEKTIRKQNLRMALLKPEERSEEMMSTVIFQDVEGFKVEGIKRREKKTLGFKYSK